MRRVEWVYVFRSSSGLISAFPIWAPKHQFCSQLQTPSAAPGPHTGWCAVSLSSCEVRPCHCVLATGCFLGTLHCPTGENSSCLMCSTKLSLGPAGVPRTMCRKQELARARGCAWRPTKCRRRHWASSSSSARPWAPNTNDHGDLPWGAGSIPRSTVVANTGKAEPY